MRCRSENQRALLTNALAVANRVPAPPAIGGGHLVEETAWKNCWNWCVSLLPLRLGAGPDARDAGTSPTLRSEASFSTSATDASAAR